MTVQVVKHFFYRVEVEFPHSKYPIVFFRKEGKCTTAKGMDRQQNRIVNESCDQWRDYEFSRLTVTRVPESEVSNNIFASAPKRYN